MKPMVRSRSTVMRSVRETPGRRLSFISISLVVSAPRRRATAWLVAKNALGSKPDQSSRGGKRPMAVRRVLLSTLAGLMAALAPTQAPGQMAYPSQTIKFVVPYPAGGLPDTVARVVGRRLQERFGQTLVIENRDGSAGAVGANALAASAADGYTLLVSDGAILSVNPQIYSKLPYDPKDIAPIAYLAVAPLFLAVHPKVPVATLQQFVDYAKSQPGMLNYGSSGVGSIHHISMEALKAALQLNLTNVPYH